MLRQGLALVKLHGVQPGAVLPQDVLIDPRRLAGDVLQHKDVGVEREWR